MRHKEKSDEIKSSHENLEKSGYRNDSSTGCHKMKEKLSNVQFATHARALSSSALWLDKHNKFFKHEFQGEGPNIK